ncbi:MAG: catalase family protein [Deltaproteobacteria bacterium]|jgi:hypothetical protein|nr:catalase family protein [Deltaproteobacteria bacterium]
MTRAHRSLALGSLVVALATACGPRVPIPASARLGAEYPFPDEERRIQEVVDLAKETMKRDYPAGTPAKRDAHIKAHGCVRADVTVRDDVPAELRHGVFAAPGPYRAWIRYSNGLPKPPEDNGDNLRGMAIKLTGVAGPKLMTEEVRTQDFLLVNYPVFIVADPTDYVEFARAVSEDSPLGYFLGWNPFDWKIRDLRALLDAVGQETPSLLAASYFSEVPYRMGEGQAAKFAAKPCASVAATMPDDPSPSYLREDLVKRLAAEPACFELGVQLQKDAVAMPVEDPTIEWDEEVSPFVPVATIEIPAQKFDSPAQDAFCENLSFSPWHASPELQPLGAINRARRVIYDEISKVRHGQNAVKRTEPTGFESF